MNRQFYNLKLIVRTFLDRVSPSRLTWPGVGLLALGFSLLYIEGCGDSNSTPIVAGNSQVTALPDSPTTFAQIRAIAPSQDCPHTKVYLAGNFSWEIVTGRDFDFHDLWTFNEDCTFRTFECGMVGYLIDGGQTTSSGLIHIMSLGYITPKDGCQPLGETSCAYGVDGAGELRLSCQLLNPLLKPFP